MARPGHNVEGADLSNSASFNAGKMAERPEEAISTMAIRGRRISFSPSTVDNVDRVLRSLIRPHRWMDVMHHLECKRAVANLVGLVYLEIIRVSKGLTPSAPSVVA